MFGMRPTAHFRKLMNSFALYTEINVRDLRFYIHGVHVFGYMTPKSRGVKDGDVIEVFRASGPRR